MKLGQQPPLPLRSWTLALLAGVLICTASTSSLAVDLDTTNREFLQWCQINAGLCQEEVKHHITLSILVIETMEAQIGRCIMEIPEDVSAEVLINVSINYIKNKAGPDEKVRVSFSKALMETFPCPK